MELVGTSATSACRWTLGRDLGHYVQVVGRLVGTSASSAGRGTLCSDLGLYALVEGPTEAKRLSHNGTGTRVSVPAEASAPVTDDERAGTPIGPPGGSSRASPSPVGAPLARVELQDDPDDATCEPVGAL